MKQYSGKIESVDQSAEFIFEFLSDFRHFETFLPEQISQWEADETYCMFVVQGLGKIKLVFLEKIPGELIVIQPAPDSGFPIPFFLKVFLKQDADSLQKSSFQFVVEAEVNSMIAMMVDRPLQQFVDIITLRLKDHLEGNKSATP